MKNKAHMFPKAKQVQLETFFFFFKQGPQFYHNRKKIHLHWSTAIQYCRFLQFATIIS